MKGIFVNEDSDREHVSYASAIVDGEKTIETRTKNMLRPLVGERVAIISTRRGLGACIIGHATIDKAFWCTADRLNSMRSQTLIPKGSKYDCYTGGKWCYYLVNPERCEPYPLPGSAVRHGRSWCEWEVKA